MGSREKTFRVERGGFSNHCVVAAAEGKFSFWIANRKKYYCNSETLASLVHFPWNHGGGEAMLARVSVAA